MFKKIFFILFLSLIIVESKSCNEDENPSEDESTNKVNDIDKKDNNNGTILNLLSKNGYHSFFLDDISKTDCDSVKGEIKDLDSKSICLIKFYHLIEIKNQNAEKICQKLIEKYDKYLLKWNPTENTCRPELSIFSKY